MYNKIHTIILSITDACLIALNIGNTAASSGLVTGKKVQIHILLLAYLVLF